VPEVEIEVATEASSKGRRVRATEEAFLLIQEFLTDEADLLDHDQHLEWVEMLTDDIQYRMPIRETRYRFDGDGFVENGDSYFNDNRLSLGLKAMRVLGIAAPRGPATEPGAGGGRVPR